MLLRFIQPLRGLARLFTAAGTPRQLALGLAMGMLIGLVPKGNLTAVLLAVILLASRVNLGAGMIGAALFSWVGMLVDPLSHRIGQAFLTHESLQPTWAYLYDLPLAPWTALNNTVVLGSLLLGLWLFYPVYRLSELAFAHGQPRVVDWLKKYRIGQLLGGAEMAAGWRDP
ncbi:MAG TPA: TIGR03546 family protein [Thermoguttaceae bacterium]|nr:TIGR03546 family protein [Thermoguttaceae bacterium]